MTTVIRPTIKVQENLIKVDDKISLGTYKSLNEDPQLLLLNKDKNNLTLKRGEYYLFLQIKQSEGRLKAPSLYIDTGDGFSEESHSRFKAHRIDQDKWFIHFSAKKNIRIIRLDPTESVCQFTLVDIFLVPARKLKLMNLTRAATNFVPAPLNKFVSKNTSREDVAAKYHFHAIDILPSFSSHGEVYEIEEDNNTKIESIYKIEYDARLYASHDGRYYHEYAGLATDGLGNVASDVKSIAFYLPQMHPIPENDTWWGKGFTEWTNVSKAVPRFAGHYQPRLPGELGFYDLRAIETIRRQVELANTYGLNAFCFYYYWFSGHRLLDRPLDMFVAEKNLNLEFCICWANENWTRRWDGMESDILIAQNHNEEDSKAIFGDWLRYFRDERYLKIDGKPLLLIYRPDLIPNFEETSVMWREMALSAGLDGLHILAANAFGNKDLSVGGLDGLYEFPPHNIRVPHIDSGLAWFDLDHKTHAFSYADAVNYAKRAYETEETEDALPLHPGVLVGWDTEPRKPGRGDVMVGSNPVLFRQWLDSAYSKASKAPDDNAKLVFINAWNEWAEGAYLEPDRRHGYGFLTALRSVIREHGLDSSGIRAYCEEHNRRATPPAKNAIILHIFYSDLVDEFANRISQARQAIEADLIVTFPELWTEEQVKYAVEKLAPRKAFVVDNVGRDVYPFITACRNIKYDNYEYACKIHSKKSTHRVDGERWRNDLVNGLLSPEALKVLRAEFFNMPEYSIAAPENAFLSLGNRDYIAGNRIHFDALVQMFGVSRYEEKEFVAGTMFWFRYDSLAPVFDCTLSVIDFGADLGQVDGTLAHAFERVFAAVSIRADTKAYKIRSGFNFSI